LIDNYDRPNLYATKRDGQWSHQANGVEWLRKRPYVALHWEMGTGKTRAILDHVAESKADRVLVVCPKSVIQVWLEQIAKHAPGLTSLALTKGDAKKKANLVNKSQCQIVIVNYESYWLAPLAKEFLSIEWDLVVYDEAHKLKTPMGKASRFAARLRKRTKQVALLSGTMLPHSPLDAFAIYRAMDPGIFGPSYTRFRSRHAVTNPMFPSQVKQWINQDEMKEKLARCTYRVTKEEVLDLPDVMHERVPITLPPNAQPVYDRVAKVFWADVRGGRIVASNALAQLLRLQQLTSGVAVTEDGTKVRLHSAKALALSEIIDGLPTDEPIVTFSRFHVDLDAVSLACDNLDRPCRELSGRCNGYALWKSERGGEVLNAQIQAGGVGVDLSRARYCIYISLGFSLADYEQSLARLHRAGQGRKVIYYHLVATNTVDGKVYKALRERKKVIEAVLS